MSVLSSIEHSAVLSCLILVVAAGLMVSTQTAYGADDSIIEGPMAGYGEWAEAARKDWGIPGFALAVVKDGETIFAEGFGLRNIDGNLPFTTDTVSHIGSTTKAFVTMSLAMLADDGYLDWDDKVSDHIPGFRLKDPWVSRELTIRDILTHRAGFANHDMMWARGMDRKESVRRMAAIAQVSSMRTTWAYNNLGYILAGEIIEARSGMAMEDFINARILQPLGMTDTTLRWKNTRDLEMLTDAHYRIGLDGAIKVPYSNIDAAGGAGVINSTVLDMSKWLQFLLTGGEFDNKRLVSEKNFDDIFKSYSIVDVPIYPAIEQTDAHFLNYGFAWFLQDFEGRKLIMHTGSIGGLTAIMSFMPEEKVGFVGLFNRQTSELRHAAMYEVFDRFTDGHSGKDWSGDLKDLYFDAWSTSETVIQNQLSSQIKNTETSLDLKAYTGNFSNDIEGEIDIEQVKNEQLVLHLAPMLSFRAEHFHYDTFVLYDASLPLPVALAGKVIFALNAGGKVDSLSMNGVEFKKTQQDGDPVNQ